MRTTLLKIAKIQHVTKDGKVIWESENLPNMFHGSGEEFILRAMFTGGQDNTYIPTNYYFGLDNRAAIAASDTMTTIADDASEPSGAGYSRQAVASLDQFTISVSSLGHIQAMSPIVTFVAVGTGWGPVQNLFFTDKTDNTGFLISSVALNAPISPSNSEGVHMRLSLSLGYCPALPSV